MNISHILPMSHVNTGMLEKSLSQYNPYPFFAWKTLYYCHFWLSLAEWRDFRKTPVYILLVLMILGLKRAQLPFLSPNYVLSISPILRLLFLGEWGVQQEEGNCASSRQRKHQHYILQNENTASLSLWTKPQVFTSESLCCTEEVLSWCLASRCAE